MRASDWRTIGEGRTWWEWRAEAPNDSDIVAYSQDAPEDGAL